MRTWAWLAFAMAAACSGGGDSPPPIDAPAGDATGGDATSPDAPTIDASALIDAGRDGGPRDGAMVPDGPIATDCVVGAEVIGPGHVVSNPAGINCAPDCRETVACGTTITLTALPSPGSTFAGWQGACSGAGGCTLTATGPLTIAFARFQ
jgi:hypothetical protein